MESFNEHSIREAEVSDASALVFIQASSWVANYQNPEHNIMLEDIRSIDFNSKINEWHHILNSPSYKVWVAVVSAKMVAFVAALKHQGGGEIFEQHTLPEFHRKGIGSKLISKAEGWIGREKDIYLRIPIYVQAGVNFYKKHGFAIYEEGAVDFIRTPSGKRISTVMMYRPSDTKTSLPETSPANKQRLTHTNTNAKKIVSRAELAKLSKTRASTIKYYSEIGVLPFKQKGSRLARRYSLQKCLNRLEKIKNMREQGLSIEDISLKLKE